MIPRQGRARFRIHRPDDRPAHVELGSRVDVTINSWPAHITVWTAEEWAVLNPLPADAIQAGNGCWVALRIA